VLIPITKSTRCLLNFTLCGALTTTAQCHLYLSVLHMSPTCRWVVGFTPRSLSQGKCRRYPLDGLDGPQSSSGRSHEEKKGFPTPAGNRPWTVTAIPHAGPSIDVSSAPGGGGELPVPGPWKNEDLFGSGGKEKRSFWHTGGPNSTRFVSGIAYLQFTHLHLVLRLGMRGTIHPHPHTSSCLVFS
jgi:hypothetical protein